MQYLDYFEKLAPKRIRIRQRHSYYWDDITFFCNYFSHESYAVLEIGCGTGELLNEIKGSRKTGIDFSPAMIEQARQQFPHLELYVMAAEELKLDHRYDLIILSNLIGYVSDIQRVLEQLHTVCHERTKIIVTFHNHLWEPVLKLAEWLGLKTPSPVQNWLTNDDMKNLLMLAGFECYRQTGRMIFPIYIPLLSPLLNKFIGKLPFFKYFAITGYSFARPAPRLTKEQVKDRYSVSIIMPARNESGNIEEGLKRMPRFGKWQEIIFVEGHSTDDTWEKILDVKNKYATDYRIKAVRQEGKGKADAVRKGFSIAEGDILMILDADLTVPPEDLPKFYDAIATGKGDFINGSRLVYPMEKQAMRFLNMLGNKFFSRAFSWLLEQPFKDTLCGTKVIFKTDYERLVTNRKFFGEFDPFGDFDLLFGAYKLNLKIVELPIRYRDRTYGSTNISRFRHGLILLRMCAFAARKIKFM
jgi:ubiquinone/menaquinone biosynthesis C-methylase UbiE